jgi:hypothetical protein
MNIAKERKAIDAALDNYRAQLDTIPDEQFTETPRGGGWSYAEVYSHILQATMAASIGLERCTQRVGDPKAKGLNMLGHLVFSFGRFPPVKIKEPEVVAAKMPATKISKEDAKNLIIKCRKRVDEMIPLIKSSSPTSKVKHPRLGVLNASQWFKFIRIHLQHHLKQLDRIKKKSYLR